MDRTLRTLLALCVELIGLTLLAAALILVGAYRYFEGFASVTPTEAFAFSVVALNVAAGCMIAYAVFRIGQLKFQNDLLQLAATRDALTRLDFRGTLRAHGTDSWLLTATLAARVLVQEHRLYPAVLRRFGETDDRSDELIG